MKTVRMHAVAHEWKYVLFLVLFIPSLVLSEDGNTILLRSDGLRGKKESSVKVIVSISDYQKGKLLHEVGYEVWYKEHRKSLIKQLMPEEEKGNLILMVGYEMWHYSPQSRRPIRITPQQRLLGGVSNADVATMGFSYDYSATLVKIDTCMKQHCHLLDLQAKNPEVPYQRILYWVNEATGLPVKAEFYSLSRQKLKTAYYHNNRSFIDGYIMPTEVTIIENVFGRDAETRMEYRHVEEREFPDKYFNYNYLRSIK